MKNFKAYSKYKLKFENFIGKKTEACKVEIMVHLLKLVINKMTNLINKSIIFIATNSRCLFKFFNYNFLSYSCITFKITFGCS